MHRTYLKTVLDNLSKRLFKTFGFTIRLVVHGGALMILHPGLRCREHTSEVDYFRQIFLKEMASRGIRRAGLRLDTCVSDTAFAFGLRADWMDGGQNLSLTSVME